MKLQYRYNGPGPQVHQGQHGVYEFKEDAEGRLVCEVKYGEDQELFMSLLGHDGKPLFVPLETAKAPRGKKAKAEQPVAVQEELPEPPVDETPVEDAWDENGDILGVVAMDEDADLPEAGE